ncbi:uncharacterized protein LOC110455805 [Mizuhopecten yessoensis]|uniref:uncharacterized protein LOC110455805 n=1 Tax=Mizuhopecten yessoensis TaxID=6573 RepID=UPI000B45C8F8|nr:uncharacterized protein LOC110455805 [Mizuhopecten yessoensis]
MSGHVVGDQRLEPQPEKISAIEQALRPETKTQLRSFLGLAGFYRKFIANFASIAVPLTELNKKGFPNRLEWGDSQEKAFEPLKRALTARPILKLPDLNEDFILRTDASDTGLGAVLLQIEEGLKLPVAYASERNVDETTGATHIGSVPQGQTTGATHSGSVLQGQTTHSCTDVIRQ